MIAMRRPTPPFIFGGAEVTMRLLGAELVLAGFDVTVIGTYEHPRWRDNRRLPEYRSGLPPSVWRKGTDGPAAEYTYEGVTVSMVSGSDFPARVAEVVSSTKPSLVFTSLEGSAEIVQIGQRAGIQTVAWVMDILETGKSSADAGADITVAVSHFVGRYWDSSFPVIYPPFRPVARPQLRRQRRVLMINPIREKGLDMFLHLAEQFPSLEFRAIQGWREPDWNSAALPSNVTYSPRLHDLTAEYSLARMLIAPSRVLEGFGRVVVEANLLGTPALHSNVGGLLEASVDLNGALPSDAKEAWVSGVQTLLDSAHWRMRAARARAARRFVRPLLPELRAAGCAI